MKIIELEYETEIWELPLEIPAAHRALYYKNKHNEDYQKSGENFAISGILLFVSFISLKGINAGVGKTGNGAFLVLGNFLISISILYALINFVLYLFNLLIQLMGLKQRLESDIIEAYKWFTNRKDKEILVKIVLVLMIVAYVVLWISLFYNWPCTI